MALILRASGDTQELAISDITLEKLQQVVGGYVERILCFNGEGEITHVLYVNDEARLTGLPFNSAAAIAAGQSILGDAVLMTKEEELEWQSMDGEGE